MFLIDIQAILILEKIVNGVGISVPDNLIEMIQMPYSNIKQEQITLVHLFVLLTIEACALRNSSNLLSALYHLSAELDDATID